MVVKMRLLISASTRVAALKKVDLPVLDFPTRPISIRHNRMERFNKVQAKTLSMKICKVCLSSDILCAGCSRRLEDGKITKTDIDISRAIHKISREKDFNVYFVPDE